MLSRAFVSLSVLGLFGGCAASASETAVDSLASVAAPAYRFELKARGSENPSVDTFALPSGAFIKNMTPSLNERGDVAMDFRAWDNLQHIWKNGQIVHDVADPKAVVTETALDAAGNVVFDVMGAETGNGLYRFDGTTAHTAFFSSEPLGAESWLSPRLLEDGRVGCRAGGGGARFLGYVDPDGFRKVAVEAASNPNSPYDYIFTPSFDRRGNVAVKVMLVSGGEEIRVFKAGSQPQVVAQDKRANPASALATIDNSVAMNERGDVAFIAKVEGNKRAVFRSAGGTTTELAREGTSEIGTIAFFGPAVDGSGRVVFKGEDMQRRNTIWVADGEHVARLVTAGDVLPSDKGTALALPETEADPQNRVTFGGALVMNEGGTILFSAALAQRTEAGRLVRIGTGIYAAVPAAR